MTSKQSIKLRVVGHNQTNHGLVHGSTLARLGIEETRECVLYVDLKPYSTTVDVGQQVEAGTILLPITLDGVRFGKYVELISNEPKAQERGRNVVSSDEEKLEPRLPVLTTKPGVHFDDIAGMEEAKEKIRQAIVDPFEFPDEYAYYKKKPGGGILLYGPPGCGKTFLAAAAAADSNSTFLSLKGSDIKNMFVGESEKKISQVFNLAREEQRTIIFLDEIDTILPSRTSGAAEHEKGLVGEFLAQMDGLEGKGLERNYLVLVATNRPWSLDLPLLDRFDTVIFIPHPDREARYQQLILHLAGRPLSTDLDLETIALQTDGLSGRQIERLCNKATEAPLRRRIAALRARGGPVEAPREPIAFDDFTSALSEVRSVLPSWYREALDQLSHLPEETREDFYDLVFTAEQFLLEHSQSAPPRLAE